MKKKEEVFKNPLLDAISEIEQSNPDIKINKVISSVNNKPCTPSIPHQMRGGLWRGRKTELVPGSYSKPAFFYLINYIRFF